jgi:hypothetical protein
VCERVVKNMYVRVRVRARTQLAYGKRMSRCGVLQSLVAVEEQKLKFFNDLVESVAHGAPQVLVLGLFVQ